MEAAITQRLLYLISVLSGSLDATPGLSGGDSRRCRALLGEIIQQAGLRLTKVSSLLSRPSYRHLS